MGLSRQDAIAKFGKEAYTGWDEVAAMADYKAHHGGSGPSMEQQNADAVNKYVDDLLGTARGQRDLILKKLDTEHKLALGNDDGARAQFLEKVADALEAKIGRIPYDYQRYTNRELEDYAMGSNEIATNKKLALDKLDNDEKRLSLNQDKTNRTAVESLNERGLLAGQKPTYQQTDQGFDPIAGLGGLAGSQAGVVNDGFGLDFTGLDLDRTGINLTAGNQQKRLDFDHTNKMQDITTESRRGAQDEQNAFEFGSSQANLEYEAKMKDLERQRADLLRKSKTQTDILTGIQKGYNG